MKNRLIAYFTIGFTYILACIASWFLFIELIDGIYGVYDIIIRLFIVDVIATLIIWLFGLLFRNSSFYDAYWSLIPWLMILGILIEFELFNINNIIFLLVFGIWSFRLTVNWMYTCSDLSCEDWRYSNYRAKNNKFIWHIINLFGINLMPTLLVFLGLVPAIIFVFISSDSFQPLMLIGCIIILIGTVLELFADNAMHKFKRTNRDKTKILDIGLWKFSRHPNYLGEIMVWIGVWLVLVILFPQYWMWAIGAFLIMLLFIFISIPLAEKRQKSKRPHYRDYIKKTSMLLILPRKNK